MARMGLGLRLAIQFLVSLVAAAAILFGPAGTWRFWQGWALLAVFFVPSGLAFLYFAKYDPEVAERRLEREESVGEQRTLMKWAVPAFFVVLLLPGLDHRWGWSRALLGEVPLWITLVALALALCGLLFVFRVIKVNRFAARTVRVEEGQTVISTGPYRLVRHPLYFGSVILWLFMPLALGSYVSLPAFLLLLPFYVIRLRSEEKVLRAELPGYIEYCQQTRFRLIPFVW